MYFNSQSGCFYICLRMIQNKTILFYGGPDISATDISATDIRSTELDRQVSRSTSKQIDRYQIDKILDRQGYQIDTYIRSTAIFYMGLLGLSRIFFFNSAKSQKSPIFYCQSFNHRHCMGLLGLSRIFFLNSAKSPIFYCQSFNQQAL